MKNVVWIIGGSSGLGREVAEQHVAIGDHVIISSRNQRDLDELCAHIKHSYSGVAQSFVVDYATIVSVETARSCIQTFKHQYPFPNVIYFLAGSNDENDNGLNAASTINQVLQNNFIGAIHLMNEAILASKNERLRIVIASSIAAARPRGKNIAYSTAKKALEQYCFGLMHALEKKDIAIQIVRFGYLDTRLSYGQRLPFKAAKVGVVAKQVMKLAHRTSGLYYLPKFWFVITLVVQAIPFFIFKKLKF